jgi:alkanesulfonate monooxygenase SsuD/methylene tetrahydromethanopterin reductase-like flavin-dependent oxidoreductase (luciferase family)
MWLQDEYQGYEGKFWSLPPRRVLPKPYGKLHPAMWAAGNTSSYEMAARRGLGVLGSSLGSFDELGPVLKAYKDAIGSAEPVGAFVNENVMVTTAAFLAEDGVTAAASMLNSHMTYPEQCRSLPRHVPRSGERCRCGPNSFPTRRPRQRCSPQSVEWRLRPVRLRTGPPDRPDERDADRPGRPGPDDP